MHARDQDLLLVPIRQGPPQTSTSICCPSTERANHSTRVLQWKHLPMRTGQNFEGSSGAMIGSCRERASKKNKKSSSGYRESGGLKRSSTST